MRLGKNNSECHASEIRPTPGKGSGLGLLLQLPGL